MNYSAVYATGTPGVSSAGSHTSATFYTYDIHGNVDTLLQDYNDGVMKDAGNRFKKIVYDYDLISGKVNDVAYQPGQADAFYHHYEYDAENRLTEVYTSQGKYGRHIPWWAGGLWEKDARYTYYKHGPLARIVLGQQQVQGVDYAYTLQGWLKGVNDVTASGSCAGAGMMTDLHVYDRNAGGTPSAYHAANSITFEPGFTSNTPDNFVGSIESSPTPCDTAGGYVLSDMGNDGDNVARDAYSFNLNYFGNDYKPISSTATVGTPAPLPGTTGSSLYNGNISSMAVNIPKLGDAHLYGYRYDQLNRITAMDAFTGLNTTSNIWTPVATDNYKERVSYDANGNIKTYKRNGDAARLSMDDMTYHYKPNTNQLDKVTDAAPDAASGVYDKYNDIKQGQSNGNYQYDAIGNVISDASEGITDINWNVYGKIESITKSSGTILYTYDAAGNRISKTANSKTTWYVRDGSGNVMSVYTKDNSVNGGDLTQSEAHLYGSSRLGIFYVNRNVEHPVEPEDGIYIFTRGNKFFELSNHLGNVWVTVSDRKDGVDTNSNGIVDYYMAHVVNANDYYPFGMQMPGRRYADNDSYRYGFNGKENDNETSNTSTYDYGFRIYNPGLGRFLSVDPLTSSYPWNSTYAFAENDVIRCIDLDGLEKYYVINYWKNGVKQRTEIEAYRDEDSKNIINMQFKLSGIPLTDKDVVIYDVYDEGTKKEKISQSDASELTAEQAQIFTKAFTVEKIKSGKAIIENELDNDVTNGEVYSKEGIRHLQAAKNYIDDPNEGRGGKIGETKVLSEEQGWIHIGFHTAQQNGNIIEEGKAIPNGSIAPSKTGPFSKALEKIKKNKGVPEVTVKGVFYYPSNLSNADENDTKLGVENFRKQIFEALKKVGAKKINVDIPAVASDTQVGLQNTTISY